MYDGRPLRNQRAANPLDPAALPDPFQDREHVDLNLIGLLRDEFVRFIQKEVDRPAVQVEQSSSEPRHEPHFWRVVFEARKNPRQRRTVRSQRHRQ